MKRIKEIALLFFIGFPFLLLGQTYVIDPTFNAGGSGPLGSISKMAQQADGKIIIAGGFSSYNGVDRNRIARLNADGTLDSSFNPGSGPFSFNITSIQDIAVDANGKIIVVGQFSSFRGVTRNGYVRLNPNGTVDTSFLNIPLHGVESEILLRSVKIDSNGKIIIVGLFNVTGASMSNIMRLNEDGSRDTGFNYTNVYNHLSVVTDVETLPDNRILVSSFGDTSDPLVTRFNSDGTLDTTFNCPDYHRAVYKIFVDGENKVFLGGLMVNPVLQEGFSLLKLNSDGSLATDFNAIPVYTNSISNNAVYAITSFRNKLLVGGNLNYFNQTVNDRILMLNQDGTIDNNFIVADKPNATVYSIESTANDKILLTGNFYQVGSQNCRGIVRLMESDLSTPDTAINDYFDFFNDGIKFSFHCNKSISCISLFDASGRKLEAVSGINTNDFDLENHFGKGFKIFRVEFYDGSERIVKTVD